VLDDAPRKLLRILCNHRYVPTIAELARKSGRTPGEVKMALRVLVNERFIEWDPNRHHELKIIQAWEYSFAPQQPVIKWWEHN
jgi:predicted transcriptional regulator